MTLGRNEYHDGGQCIGELLMNMQEHKSGTYRAQPMKLLLLALVPACFAFNPVAGRALVDAFGPATLTLVRWSLSGLVIGTFALMRHGNERWQASLSQLLQLAILAAFGMGFCSIAAYLASRTTEATNI